jgi:hypothetical protein
VKDKYSNNDEAAVTATVWGGVEPAGEGVYILAAGLWG